MRVYQFRHIRRSGSDNRSGLVASRRYHRSALSLRVIALLCAITAAVATPPAAPPDANAALPAAPASERVSVIVELDGQPARALAGAGADARIRSIARSQRTLSRSIESALPSATVRWRYRVVLNALAVELARSELAALRQLPGVIRVTRAVSYRATLDSSPALIGAASSWRPGLSNLGEGMKIGIIDDGIDVRSPLFATDGLTMPDGFPKGDTRFTSDKVIVARVFAPSPLPLPAARLPFDRKRSQHGTHVAAIAAGSKDVVPAKLAGRPRLPLSGVAPRAQLGNYRALTFPTESGLGLNGNSPEIVAAIEAAVTDGMDVINLSLGQPEVAPTRDLVARALDNAALAGVVVVVAAGNDFIEQGAGSISSPGTAREPITVGATSASRAYGMRADLHPSPASEASLAAITVAPIAGSGAGAITGMAFRPLARGSLGADPTLCAEPLQPSETPLEAGLALADAGGCTLRVKAKNAAAYGASALLVAGDDSAGYRLRVRQARVPVLMATSADVNEVAALAATAGAPRIVLASEPAVIATSDPPRVASFSAQGPTPLSGRLKPDVVAPGLNIYSAFPVRDGSFGVFSGTSMAAPHVAGGAALLLELHPSWTPAEIKSALALTGTDVKGASGSALAPPSRAGGGLVHLDQASTPLIWASPTNVSFGLLAPSAKATTRSQSIELSDAGGGAGSWTVSTQAARTSAGARLELPASVEIPGTLAVGLRVGRAAREGDTSGWIVLERGGQTRRIAYWARVVRPKLGGARARPLKRTGTYSANNRRSPSLVDAYRYPERPTAGLFRGPESVFSFVVDRPLVNFGVAIVRQGPGVSIEPRIVIGQDENTMAGVSALPSNGNPYQLGFGDRRLISGVLRPTLGRYTIVFDTRARTSAGAFTFRFWVNDTRAPTIRVKGRRTRVGVIRAAVRDRGSGVDPMSLSFNLDGGPWIPAEWNRRSREMIVDLTGLRPGRYRVGFRAADRQETKNWEYTGRVLPNTRVVYRTVDVVGR